MFDGVRKLLPLPLPNFYRQPFTRVTRLYPRPIFFDSVFNRFLNNSELFPFPFPDLLSLTNNSLITKPALVVAAATHALRA